jgi:hypothetical protein
MPRAGFKSITIKENVYRELEATYDKEKIMLAREGVGSLTAFVTRIIANHIREKDDSRLKHFNIYESVIRIQDSKIGRLVDVDYRRGEMFCGLCHSTECLHTGYAWGIYRQYRTLHKPGKSRAER